LQEYEKILSHGQPEGSQTHPTGLPPALVAGPSTSLPGSAPATKIPSPAASGSSLSPVLNATPEGDRVAEKFGQLALDEHGHRRWLGNSSTFSFVSNFQTMNNPANPERNSPNSPSDEGSIEVPTMSSLYFPGAVVLGKVGIDLAELAFFSPTAGLASCPASNQGCRVSTSRHGGPPRQFRVFEICDLV
jgi:hypothetical protein